MSPLFAMSALPAEHVAASTSCLLLVCSVTIQSLGLAQETPWAQLQGRVTSKSDSPLATAEVTILKLSRTVLSDSSGRFVLSALPPGEHVIRVRRIGFRGQYLSASLEAGEKKNVTIVLEPGAYNLPDVEVTARRAKPVEYAYTTKYDDFFRRKWVGLGHYLSRADIDRKTAWRTASVLHGIPGIRLRFYHHGFSGTDIEFIGCEKVSVWVDGWKQRHSEFELDPNSIKGRSGADAALGALVDRFLPGQIEMMEVYTRVSEMPAEFLDDSCAAIVMWTR